MPGKEGCDVSQWGRRNASEGNAHRPMDETSVELSLITTLSKGSVVA